MQIQKHIAESMYKDDLKRKEKEAELEEEASENLNNLIVEDGVSNS